VRRGLASGVTIVDSHVHAWPAGLVHPGQPTKVPLAAAPSDLISTLDASGVDAALVSPALVHPSAEYLFGAADAAPSRILAVIGVSPWDAEAIAAIPDHAERGAVAVRVNLGATPLDDDAGLAGLDELASATADAGLVLQWTMRLPSAHLIERVARSLPTLPQVFDHLGLPLDARDMGALPRLAELAGVDRLHLKLSGMYALSEDGFPYEDVWPWMEGAVDAFGPERMLWASDWPLSGQSASHADLLGLVQRLPFLDTEARRAILGGNASRLWPAPG